MAGLIQLSITGLCPELLVGYHTAVVDLEKSPSNVGLSFCMRAPSARVQNIARHCRAIFQNCTKKEVAFLQKNQFEEMEK